MIDPHTIAPGKRRCDYCSQYRDNLELQDEPGNVLICFLCRAKRTAEMRKILLEPPPRSCTECRADVTRTGYWLIWKDGTHGALCDRCYRPYLAKRKDLFGHTPAGKGLF